ncbi:hypothetical protein R3X26_00455 [Vibrio sp. TH_r3]|uniref:hypothetical protein n=1 Tax=Vibrio sp. TH_r3 TaxID=3082084 RepID=UPI0029532622|nr:hypothetical protein [Vibrio sp. TH_r3]MDV7102872.1 hypothetical protein [Vibrio sp. TH_r3]
MNRSSFALVLMSLISVALIFYASHFAMGSLYKIGLENEFKQYEHYVNQTHSQGVDQSVLDKKYDMLTRVNLLTDQMMVWNQYDPNHLSMAAYTQLLNSYANQNLDIYDSFLTEGLMLSNKAIALRPIFPDVHAQKTYLLSSLKYPVEDVFDQLYTAEKFGRYEEVTTRAGLDFYFAFWGSITNQDKIKATRYLLDPEKYGFAFGNFDRFIANASYRDKACNILSISRQSIPACNEKPTK